MPCEGLITLSRRGTGGIRPDQRAWFVVCVKIVVSSIQVRVEWVGLL